MARLVYSTDSESTPDSPRRRNDSRQKPPKPTAKSGTPETIYVERDRKGRRGKTVTVMTGFTRSDDELQTLLKQLKTACGAGGTAKDRGTLEIQGDHRDRIAEWLRERGYRVKLKGG